MRTDFDSVWKETLETYFVSFLETAVPELAPMMGNDEAPVFLDQELQELAHALGDERSFVAADEVEGEVEGGAPEPVRSRGGRREGQATGPEGGDDEPVDVGVGRIGARGRHRVGHRPVGPVVGVAARGGRGLQGPYGQPGEQNARRKDQPRHAPRSRLQRSAGSRRGGMAAGIHHRDREPKPRAHQVRAERDRIGDRARSGPRPVAEGQRASAV